MHVCALITEQHTLTHVEFFGSSLLFMSIVSSKCADECPTTSITGHLLGAKHTDKLSLQCSLFTVNANKMELQHNRSNSLQRALTTTEISYYNAHDPYRKFFVASFLVASISRTIPRSVRLQQIPDSSSCMLCQIS